MTFKTAIQGFWTWYTNRKPVYELLLVVSSISLTVSDRPIQAACFVMLKTTFLPIPFVFDFEFEGRMWNVETKFGARKLEPRGCMVKKTRNHDHKSNHVVT